MMARGWPDIESYTVVSDISKRETHGGACSRSIVRITCFMPRHKHVPKMEDNPEESVRNNGMVPCDRRLAVKYGTRGSSLWYRLTKR